MASRGQAGGGASSSSAPEQLQVFEDAERDLISTYGTESGSVEARTFCHHWASLSSDLAHIPAPYTPCHRCQHPSENWLCKTVLCSPFVNKHMVCCNIITKPTTIASLSTIDWRFDCGAYLDAQVIMQLRRVYETAYILKFDEAPPFRAVEFSCL